MGSAIGVGVWLTVAAHSGAASQNASVVNIAAKTLLKRGSAWGRVTGAGVAIEVGRTETIGDFGGAAWSHAGAVSTPDGAHTIDAVAADAVEEVVAARG